MSGYPLLVGFVCAAVATVFIVVTMNKKQEGGDAESSSSSSNKSSRQEEKKGGDSYFHKMQQQQQQQSSGGKDEEEPSGASAAAASSSEFLVDAGAASDFKRGETKEVHVLHLDAPDAEDREEKAGSVLVTRSAARGEFSAVSGKCTHNAAALCHGGMIADTDRVRCPLHGACYSLVTGDIEDFPCSDALTSFPTLVRDGRVLVDVSQTAAGAGLKKGLGFPGSKRTMDMPGAASPSAPARTSNAPLVGKDQTVVVVGAGPAGLTCAEGLRQAGFAGKVVLVGKEAHAPIDRTKLSKLSPITADKASEVESYAASIALRDTDFLSSANVDFRPSTLATGIDRAGSRLLLGSSGEALDYDHLVLATGGDARVLPCPGHELEGIWPVREVEHARGVAAGFKGKNVVIVGTSFIGMEVAASSARHATSVTAVGMEKVPFERVLGPEVGAALQALHEKNGVKFRFERVVKEFRPSVDDAARVGSVVLDDDSVLPADLVVLGAGMIPVTKWALSGGDGATENNGFDVFRDQSICCEATLRVKKPASAAALPDNVWAVGDLARFPYFATKTDVRVEHYGAAMHMGRTAAKNIVATIAGSDPEPLHTVPFFWTGPCFGKTVRYAGHAFGWDEQLFEGDVMDLKFACFFTKGDLVTAVCTVGLEPLTATVAELIHYGRMCDVPTLKKALAKGDVMSFLKTL